MAQASAITARKRRPRKASGAAVRISSPHSSGWGLVFSVAAVALGTALVYGIFEFHAAYAMSLQWPLHVRLDWPLVIARRSTNADSYDAQLDQRYPLTAYQQYACRKFGPACRVALAIQRAENPQGKCEIYHYNNDGTLDWGYFQINTVHLKRPGVVLRNLLDCKANIDFAYLLYQERQGFSAWSTFNSGAYRKYLHTNQRSP